MRRVEFLVPTDLLGHRVEWQRAQDHIRCQWLRMNRHPFFGPVAVGYEWRVKVKPRWQRHANLWPRVVWLAAPIINGGEPYPGVCRFVESDEPRLTLYLETP